MEISPASAAEGITDFNSVNLTNETDVFVANFSGRMPDGPTLEMEFAPIMSRFDVHLTFNDESAHLQVDVDEDKAEGTIVDRLSKSN